MAAEVIALFPIGERADETVRRTISGLIRGRQVKVEDVASAVGMATATLYRRLAGSGSQQAFGAGEVATLARYFGVSIEQLYTGLGGVFVPPDPDGSEASPVTLGYPDSGRGRVVAFPSSDRHQIATAA